MGFLLLGVDSLIACIAVGPITSARARWPLALCFGIGDGAGFLLGTAFHWNMPDRVANAVVTGVLLALGVYWIFLAMLSGRAAGTRWIWILPWVLSVDNVTYSLISDHWTTSVWGQAGEQALSSTLLALIGLLIGLVVPRMIPAMQRSRGVATGVTGGALILAAGLELLVG